MKKKIYLAPEIETTVFTYEDLMLVFSGEAPDTDEEYDFVYDF